MTDLNIGEFVVASFAQDSLALLRPKPKLHNTEIEMKEYSTDKKWAIGCY